MPACRDSCPVFWQPGSSFVIDLAGKCELIPVGVLEDGDQSPGFIIGFFRKGDALGLEDFGSGENVVAPKRDGLKLADALLVPLWRVEGYACLSAGNEEFNPALCVRERLVSDHFQSQGLGVELQRNVLIANRNAYKLNSPNHKCPSSVRCAEHSQEN